MAKSLPRAAPKSAKTGGIATTFGTRVMKSKR